MTLKEARKALGWTQQRMADAAGIGQQHISDLENGDFVRVGYVTVTKIVKALHRAGLRGVTADELFPIEEKAS